MTFTEHVHRCANRKLGCTSEWACRAGLERNHDGFPEVICRADMAATGPMECEECKAGRCEDCGCLINITGEHDECCDVKNQGREPDDLTGGL